MCVYVLFVYCFDAYCMYSSFFKYGNRSAEPFFRSHTCPSVPEMGCDQSAVVRLTFPIFSVERTCQWNTPSRGTGSFEDREMRRYIDFHRQERSRNEFRPLQRQRRRRRESPQSNMSSLLVMLVVQSLCLVMQDLNGEACGSENIEE